MIVKNLKYQDVIQDITSKYLGYAASVKSYIKLNSDSRKVS